MRSSAARWVIVLSVAAALLIGIGAISVVIPTASAASGVGNVTAENITMEIAVQDNGNAGWTVRARYVLSSPSEEAAFDRLASEFRDGETDALSVTPFREAASQAADETGRDMEIRGVSRTVEQEGETGVLVLRFTWTAFGDVRDDRLVLGDAFQSHDGTWLPRLESSQTLIVSFPDEYSIVDSSQPLRNGTFRIEGPEEFSPGEPAAVLEQTGSDGSSPPGGVTTTNGVVTTTVDTPVPGFSFPTSMSLGILVVIVGLSAYLLVRRSTGLPGGESSVSPDDGGDDGAGAPLAEGSEPVVDEEPLLADEERVLRLLEANDGRMKQVAIVDETDWSNAKVSQLLSEMDERGEIDKLRIGRENLISLPGESPRDPE